MAKGGARGRSGPAPDPQALRRDRDDGDWTTLPADGRKGAAPKWPLRPATELLGHMLVYGEEGEPLNELAVAKIGRAIAKRELEVWRREWKRPQAVQWERLGLEVEVALYVRALVAAEGLDAPVNLRTLVKQQQEALGISLPGLARNHWRIGTPVLAAGAAAATRRAKGRSARDRFKVVPGGRD